QARRRRSEDQLSVPAAAWRWRRADPLERSAEMLRRRRLEAENDEGLHTRGRRLPPLPDRQPEHLLGLYVGLARPGAAPRTVIGFFHEGVMGARGSAWESSQDMIWGQTTARASRTIKIPRCCRHTPLSPGTSKMRTSLVGMASIKGWTETLGATSSATLTTASVGAVRVTGPIGLSAIFKLPSQKRFS